MEKDRINHYDYAACNILGTFTSPHCCINLNAGHIQLKLNTLANSFISYSETAFFTLVSNNASSLVVYFQI